MCVVEVLGRAKGAAIAIVASAFNSDHRNYVLQVR
jgi:hypothetical protein